ncbi:MAG: inositol monophosphatase family protein [Bdellovibrionota bacterium]
MKTLPQAEIDQAVALATQLARRVGARIREVAQSEERLDVSHKGISDIVTEIDLWSEQEILRAVGESFPHHVVVGEETSAELEKATGKPISLLVDENVCWIVDPLDGTTNFSNKIPHSAVSIAITAWGERVGAVVYDPFREELYEARKGHGARMNDRPIRVSPKTELVQSVAAVGFPNDRWTRWEEYKDTTNAIIMSCRNVRACGAAAIEISWVGSGRFEAFFEYGIRSWDIAAGSLIVEEAGGCARSFGNTDGKEFSLFGRSFLFCTPGVLEALLEVIRTKKPIELKK